MDVLKNLFGKKSAATASNEAQNNSKTSTPVADKMIEVYDAYGRQLQVRLEDWRTNILPGSIKQHWNDPDNLYSLIVQSLRDGLAEDVLKPAYQLHKIDPNQVRGAMLLGVVLLELKKYSEAEQVLMAAKKLHGGDGYLLTNLAKVYSAQGKETLAHETLWQALQQDPNQDNGLLWFVAIAREQGGVEAEKEALTEVAALPNSWRAYLWLARMALANKDIALAKQHYDKVFVLVSNLPADVLMQISGDLGNAGYVEQIIETIAPHYDIAQHGFLVGNNILKAYLELQQTTKARELLEKLYAQNRPDWKSGLQFWENEIEKLTHHSGPIESTTKPTITMVTIEGPIWAREAYGFRKLLPEKSDDALKIYFICGSAEDQTTTKNDKMISQKADAVGRFTRGLPLFLAEQIHLQTNAKGICAVPWVEQGGFVLTSQPWTPECFKAFGLNETDFAILLHVSATSVPWNINLSLIRGSDRSTLKSWDFSLNPNASGETIRKVADYLLNDISNQLHVTITANALFLPPEQNSLPFYISALEQGLAVMCAATMPATEAFLYSERSIFDALLDLAASQPANIPARMLLIGSLIKENERRPDIVQEFCQKLDHLQKDKPLLGEIGETIRLGTEKLMIHKN